MKLHDQAHQLFVDHSRKEQSGSQETLVVQLIPTSDGVMPPLVQIGSILAEAGSIVIAYKNLQAADLAPQAPAPAIGPPMFLPFLILLFRLHKLVERISNSGTGCPAITQQHTGTVMCGVLHIYSNVAVTICVPRVFHSSNKLTPS
jgi:hypothetical protein